MNTTPKIDDGGPAFPATPALDVNGNLLRPVDIGQPGMSLRDWFAGQAMAGIMACNEDTVYDPKIAAKTAWTQADAMLRTRQLPPT